MSVLKRNYKILNFGFVLLSFYYCFKLLHCRTCTYILGSTVLLKLWTCTKILSQWSRLTPTTNHHQFNSTLTRLVFLDPWSSYLAWSETNLSIAFQLIEYQSLSYLTLHSLIMPNVADQHTSNRSNFTNLESLVSSKNL